MADQYAYKAGTDFLQPKAVSPTTAALGQLAVTAISAFNSYQMDKIRYEMEQDVANFKRKTRIENRLQQAWFGARNQAKLKESLASERLALDIEQMKQTAAAKNKLSAANIGNTSSVVRDIKREQLREDLYQEREQTQQLEKLKVSTIDAQKSQEVVYDAAPAQSSFTAFGNFGIDALKIGKAAYQPFVPAKEN